MRAWSLAAALMIALAGCAEPEELDGAPAAADASDLEDQEVEGSDLASNGTSLVAAIEVTLRNGTAPLRVAFNLTAEGAGPDATWSIDFGDGNATNGTGLPAQAEHVFGAGDFTVVFEVVDGNASAQSTLDIAVSSSSAAAGRFIESAAWTGDGLLVTGVQACGAVEGVDYAEHVWDASALVAQPYAVSNILLQMENGPGTVDIDITLLAPDGSNVGTATAFDALDGPESIEASGPFPAGEYTLQVSACSGAAMEYAWELTADLLTV